MLSQELNEVLTRVSDGAPMGELISRFWIPALLSEEIESPDCPPVRVSLLGHRLIAFRDTNGDVGLLDARCPHRSVDLFFGRNEEGGIRCVYHGWKFDRTGKCLDIPSEPAESRMKEHIRARAYPTYEKAGLIWTYLGPGDAPPMPDLEFLSLPVGNVYVSKRLMQCNYMQALEGSIDTAHLTFLHSAKNMKRDVFGVGQYKQFSDKDGAPKFFCRETPYGMSISARREGDEKSYYWRLTQWLMPVGVLVPTASGAVCRANFFVPIDDESCWWYRIRYHIDRSLTKDEVEEYESGSSDYSQRVPGTYISIGNRNNNYLIDRDAQRAESFTGIPSAQLQDIAVQESQGTVVDREIENLGTSDTAIVMCRRKLIELALSLQEGKEPLDTHDPKQYRVRAVAFTLDRSKCDEEAAAVGITSVK